MGDKGLIKNAAFEVATDCPRFPNLQREYE